MEICKCPYLWLRQTLKCMILTCRYVVPMLSSNVLVRTEADDVFYEVVGIDGWCSGFD